MIGAVLLAAAPPLGELLVRGWTIVFRYFAGDAYLYLTVGRNFADLGKFTMDQVHATSGFHPLWQLVIGLVHVMAGALGLGKPAILVTVYLMCVLLIGGAVVLMARAHLAARGRLPALFLLMPVGVVGLAMAGYDPAFGPRGTLWGFVNGMESGLTLVGYGLLALLLVGRDPVGTFRRALGVGAVLAFLVLARLDNAFLVAGVCGTLGLRALLLRDLGAFRLAAATALPVVAVLLVYFAFNLATVGLAMPVSFLAKSSAFSLGKFGELRTALGDEGVIMYQWRLLQIVLPLAVGLGALVQMAGAWRRPRLEGLDLVLLSTAVFVVLTGLYHFFFVPTLAQGHWYFPVSFVFVSWYLLLQLDRPAVRRFTDNVVVAALCVAVTGWLFIDVYVGSEAHGPELFERIMTTEAAALQAHYGDEPPRVLSYEDGILAYATGWPVMTGRGYLLDKGSIEYFRRDDLSLLKVAYDRGFDRVTVSPFHNRKSGIAPAMRSRSIATVLARRLRMNPAEFRAFAFEVDYISKDGRFVIVRMKPQGRRAMGKGKGK